MAKRRYYELEKSELRNRQEVLYKIIAEIDSQQGARNFLKDLLTSSEALMISNRIAIAMMLLNGFKYEDIIKELKVGVGTINNVNRWLYNGFGGYLKELRKNKKTGKSFKKMPASEWDMLKKKYPAHFFIFNLMDKLK
jgi:uncharacterized protein YerC